MNKPHVGDTTGTELENLLASASAAAPGWAAMGRSERARVLRATAEALDNAADSLVPVAAAETHLTEGRLRGELARTTFQLRLFADVLVEGGYLDVRMDHADPDWSTGPRPDLRRWLEPVGPVLVFSASNFPFAFSVAGGDTASALAAGCPVLVKAHPGHPRLSAMTAAVVQEAMTAAGAGDSVFSVVYGVEAGRTALMDARVMACGFTGSISSGRALFDLAMARRTPIPFFGELGSVNPTIVTPGAAHARGQDIIEGFIGSMTLGAGQFCTKPGLLLVPADGGMLPQLADARLPAAKMLNSKIEQGYEATLSTLLDHPAVSLLTTGHEGSDDQPAPVLATAPVTAVLDDFEALTGECFGPAALVVTYEDFDQVLEFAGGLAGQLTSSIHGELGETGLTELVRLLARTSGRVLWNQWPTGVAVTHAQQHGGPYPATTAVSSTSVGTAAINRFLRPVAYQGFPEGLLPPDLRDTAANVPRRVNGGLTKG